MAYTILINDPLKTTYIDAFRKEKGGLGRADVIKMALAEFMVNHPVNGLDMSRERQVQDAAALYKILGYVKPDLLQRRLGLAYNDAVSVIKELVERGMVPPEAAKDVVTQ
jgi:hypothetical protein